MEEQIALEVNTREKIRKSELKKLRRDGLVPAILYGNQQQASLLSIKGKELEKIIKTHGDNVLLSLKNSQKKGSKNPDMVMIKDIQRHPLLKGIVHVDLYKVSLEQTITTLVPVRVVGEQTVRTNSEGITDLIIRELEIRSLPTNIPQYILVDVSELNIGDTLHVQDMKVDEGIEITTEMDRTVVTIVPPSKVEEPVLKVPEELAEGEEATTDEEGEKAEAEGPSEEGAETDKAE